MDPIDRRKFLRQAGVATAAGGAAVVMPASFAQFLGENAAGAAPAHSTQLQVPEGTKLDQPLVAYIRDLSTGEVSLFKGDKHITVHDKQLAAHLFNAAR